MKLFKTTSNSIIRTIAETNAGFVNPDPIGQRPPVSSRNNKAQGIIESVMMGISVGAITVRNIENDDKAQEIYPGVKWLVVDGGNRIRAMRDFYNGRFPLKSGENYLNLTEEDREKFDNTELTFFVYECDDVTGTEIFRRLNTVTPVNQIEMTMANDVSEVAKQIRTRVKSYKEYGYNDIHPIFEVKTKKDGTMKAVNWSTDINPRRKWDEFVAVAILKALGGGNVNAGLDSIEKLVEDDPVLSKKVLEHVDSFLTDAMTIAKEKNYKLNADTFGAMHCVWFGLLERNNVFAITDYTEFANEFYKVHAELTGKTPNFNDDTLITYPDGERGTIKQDTNTIKKFARKAIAYPSNPAMQNHVASMYIEQMNLTECVIFRDTRRTVTKDEKFEMLAAQNFRCAIDGEPLDINDAIFGHDTAWAHGGQLEDGQIIRKIHNVNMGTTTLDEYRMILDLRKAKAS